ESRRRQISHLRSAEVMRSVQRRRRGVHRPPRRSDARPRLHCSLPTTRRIRMPDPLLIAKNAQTELFLLPGLANRHGLITGATGTGKTVTLQVMAERFSGIGVPVFMAD